MATYIDGLDVRNDDDELQKTTWDTTYSGSEPITVGFENENETGTIYMYWYVLARNIPQNVDDDFDNTGTIYLT